MIALRVFGLALLLVATSPAGQAQSSRLPAPPAGVTDIVDLELFRPCLRDPLIRSYTSLGSFTMDGVRYGVFDTFETEQPIPLQDGQSVGSELVIAHGGESCEVLLHDVAGLETPRAELMPLRAATLVVYLRLRRLAEAIGYDEFVRRNAEAARASDEPLWPEEAAALRLMGIRRR